MRGAEEDPLRGTAYRTLDRLSGGGMGEVLLAEHRELHLSCVVKVLRSELASDPRFVDRLRLEAQALGRLKHPHIVSVKGAGVLEDGRPFLVLEHLRGRTLSQELKERGGRLTVFEALRYASEILSAVAAAHRLGIVHRDLKPANIFLCPGPEGRLQVKVLDFGIARVLPDAPPGAPAPLAHPTEEGAVVGTARFMSPEAALGDPVDGRADVYAVALVLYEMLTGRGPFDHLGKANYLTSHAVEPPEPPSRYALDPVAPELDRAVLRALSKNAVDRYATAQEFQDVLEKLESALRRPQGWLETTTFSSEEQADTEVFEPPFADEQPAGPAPRVIVAESSPPSLSSGGSATSAPRRVWRLALLFFVTVALSALAGVALRQL